MPELRRQIGDWHALGDLDARVAMAQIVRAVVGNAGGLAGVPHRVADCLPACGAGLSRERIRQIVKQP
jgi:hypothetical protein